MELPQSRPLGTEGRKATHDFLSLYSSSTPHAQQDPTPPQGGYLKTHDFLQPLERVGKNPSTSKEENKAGMSGVVERLPPVTGAANPASVEHILPGGIGTYSISYFNQRANLKPDQSSSLFAAQASSTSRNDENSNGSSYAGSGFTLWEESSVKKGKTGKENINTAERHILREAGVNVVGGQWTSMLENPSQSSSSHKQNMTATFSSFSSSQPASSQKNQSFLDMITSAKNDQEEDDDDDDDEFSIKREPSSQPKGNVSVKIEAKTIEQRPNTPRSKHSATEQRRRSKINDRFQKLREIIPNSDQKRDKASFLLEVIDYIQFLQEKVNRFENSYNVWNHEPSKMMQWRNCHIAEGFIDHPRGANTDSGPSSIFPTKFDENKAVFSPVNGQKLVDSDISSATTKAAPVHPNIFNFGRTSPVSPKQASDTDKTMTWPPSQFQLNRSCTPDCSDAGNKTKDQEPTVESGTINISTVYSQGLLNTLTQALQSSGVDLSQASISVQIDLGKRANAIPQSSASTAKEDDVPAGLPRSRAASTGDDFGHALKRLRTS